MARGLDHIVHAVRDLDAAAALYARMGFTVGARNRHPWGTHNHIVQLPGFFIELLAVAEPEKFGADGFSKMFGAFNRDFLARGEGFSLLILESADAAADEAGFRAAGIAASDVMRFEREAKRPDGTTVKVAFSLAFAEDKGAPDIHFATCQQHFPENFWNPAFQRHANGAQGIAGIVLAAGKPADHRDFLASYCGQSDVRASANSMLAKTPRGEIAILDPVNYRNTFGIAPPPVTGGARLAAMRLAVADIEVTDNLLRAANVDPISKGGRIVVGAASAMGATIVFEQSGKPGR